MKLESFGIKTHFVAAGAAIDGYLPAHLRGDHALQSRAMIVKKLDMTEVEFVARSVLTGSGLKEYNEKGSVCGLGLPEGLQDGDALPFILDTPTTKASEGHDMSLDAATIRQLHPEQTRLLAQIFQIIATCAEQLGIKFADTKLEMGLDEHNNVVVGDEVGTPDSSRFWELEVWRKSRVGNERKAPPPYDKQLVRAWGIEQGINKLNPLNSEHLAQAHAFEVPEHLIRATTQTYRYIFWRLVGCTVEDYMIRLGVKIERPRKHVAILFGSESDIPVVRQRELGLLFKEFDYGKPDVHVISCHRNPDKLRSFVDINCHDADVVIAAGGLAFALPGVLKALLDNAGKEIPVIGVALGQPGSDGLIAAQLSISQLPGTPVIMNEVVGEVYTGAKGFKEALLRVASGELPPPKPRTVREAKILLPANQLYE
jgi:phosphoribosylaminoimidazole-succinocarboxamide synthase